MSRGIFNDNPFVKVTPGVYPSHEVEQPGTVAKGGFWAVVLQDGEYVLDYISGEFVGTAKQVKISEAEAASLAGGDDAAAIAVINAHAGG